MLIYMLFASHDDLSTFSGGVQQSPYSASSSAQAYYPSAFTPVPGMRTQYPQSFAPHAQTFEYPSCSRGRGSSPFGMRGRGVGRQAWRANAHNLAERMGIEGHEHMGNTGLSQAIDQAKSAKQQEIAEKRQAFEDKARFMAMQLSIPNYDSMPIAQLTKEIDVKRGVKSEEASEKQNAWEHNLRQKAQRLGIAGFDQMPTDELKQMVDVAYQQKAAQNDYKQSEYRNTLLGQAAELGVRNYQHMTEQQLNSEIYLARKRAKAKELGVRNCYRMSIEELNIAIQNRKDEKAAEYAERQERKAEAEKRQREKRREIEKEKKERREADSREYAKSLGIDCGCMDAERVDRAILHKKAENLGISTTGKSDVDLHCAISAKHDERRQQRERSKEWKQLAQERENDELIVRAAERKPGQWVSYAERLAERNAYVARGGYDGGLCRHSDGDEIYENRKDMPSHQSIVDGARTRLGR